MTSFNNTLQSLASDRLLPIVVQASAVQCIRSKLIIHPIVNAFGV
jgi:hypothetical protein